MRWTVAGPGDTARDTTTLDSSGLRISFVADVSGSYAVGGTATVNGRACLVVAASLNVRAAGGYDVDPDRVLTGAETAEIIFQSQYDLAAVLRHSPLPNMEGYYGTDLTPRMGEITIPSLVLWGEHDIITPYVEAQPGYEALGAPPDQKRLVMFADSGHNPWAEEPEKFYDVVSEFIAEVLPPR